MQEIVKSVAIQAPPAVGWRFLTRPELMMQWMGEPEMQLKIITDWIVGNPIVIKGFQHEEFVNRGTVLQFIQNNLLRARNEISCTFEKTNV